jgi:hypothetical protein
MAAGSGANLVDFLIVAVRGANASYGSCVTKRSRSKRQRTTLWEMKVGPSGSVIRSLIPSHRGPLWSKATVVSAAETSGL